MSIHAIREAFNGATPTDSQSHKAIRCVAARMSYTGAKRDHQILEFDIVVPPDIKATITTDPIAPGASLLAAAADAAAQALKTYGK